MAPEGYPSGMSVSVSERFHTNLNVIEQQLLLLIKWLLLFSHERCASGSFGPMKWSHHSNVISLEAPNYHHITRSILFIIINGDNNTLYTLHLRQARSPAELKHIIKRRKRN